ncbi:PREDICTED: tubulin--tyrosine ligase-like protein 12 [Dinoponera quadriceps]|uniref:Tubulin--tyrosine ligase-like protein 12 n=1 Tax=Dinoponera quadriceps TaxID=609295 RepID=A0A6P3XA07_DINQU|nr:PREDICTED: tubulin--tyrosine ligase-like protein 12 [Dinoponera quadriceps]XP_014475087.1 PREDICTED: tubulin--tyrosine ligase-like protein 12 [Dinoponera quadriceps]XP_014475088.1 PREDICTED: tubulin--tyrosine ligase-like protein 12 [Dinoponera quadriceps]
MNGIDLYSVFLEIHKPQLESSGIPQLFWKTLFEKLENEVFDGGLVFQLAKVEYEGMTRHITEPVWKLFVSVKDGLSAQDSNNIYLIDHAWLYDTRSARQNLTEVPGLLDRMCSLMDIDTNAEKQEIIECVMKEMWRYNQSFSLNSRNVEESMPMWYIMDEVGSAINHSDNPNFRAEPFLHVSKGTSYTILFPIRDVAMGDEVTRDFVEGQASSSWMRRLLLLPWVDSTFDIENYEQFETDEDFSKNYISETLPETNTSKADNNETLKVFSQYEYVNKYLTYPAFTFVDNDQEADILWLVTHFKAFKELSISSPRVFINQFPCEHVITVKDLLAIVCRRKAIGRQYDLDTLESFPAWLPTTYNLTTELRQFVGYFKARADANLDNHWICKPWNLARGLDITITKDLCHILRLRCTGPKIVQKYITQPVLYDRAHIGRVKFDIRYVVLLKSVKPLRAYAYANFFLRFANQPFALNNLDVYEQHFTVMNYSDENPLYHVKCAEFVVQWKNQYPDYPWESYVEPKILSVLREAFEAAIAEPPPRGIPESPQSRAVYAADLMLEWRGSEMQPKLLEINFMPDCQRACDYYPEFYNDIFRCLFLNTENPQVFHSIEK